MGGEKDSSLQVGSSQRTLNEQLVGDKDTHLLSETIREINSYISINLFARKAKKPEVTPNQTTALDNLTIQTPDSR